MPVVLVHSSLSYVLYYSRVPEKKAAYKRMTSVFGESDSHSLNPLRSSWNGSLNSLKLNDCEHTILHPGAITAMLKLIPSVEKSADVQVWPLSLNFSFIVRLDVWYSPS